MTSSKPTKVGGFPEKTFRDCKTRKEFENFLFRVYTEHYGLKCTCDECGPEIDFRQAAGHYNHCNYSKFCHAVNRAIEWSAHVLVNYKDKDAYNQWQIRKTTIERVLEAKR